MDGRVADTVRVQRHVDVAGQSRAVRLLVADPHSSEELAARFRDAEQQEGGRGGDAEVNAVLDRCEDGDEDGDEEDESFQRRGEPVRVGLPGRGDEAADRLDYGCDSKTCQRAAR